MNARCIRSIIKKDTLMAIRNNLLLMALLGGVLFSLIYYALPSDVGETYELALFDEGSSEYLELLSIFGAGGLNIDDFDSLGELTEAIEKGEYVAGIYMPENFDQDIKSGNVPIISLYYKYDLPESVRLSIEYILESSLEYLALGIEPVITSYEVLGEDMAGRQLPLRDLSLPFYIIMALMMEMWTISTLVVEENALNTLKAVLVTPATPSDVISAKSIVGIVYSLIVVTVILLITQSFRGDPAALLACILLGAILSVSLGLFLGSLTNNITGSYIYVTVPYLVLIIPGLLLFFQDVSIPYVKLIPSYYLINAFNGILNMGSSLADVAKDLLIVAVCDIVFFVLGIFSLRRRYS